METATELEPVTPELQLWRDLTAGIFLGMLGTSLLLLLSRETGWAFFSWSEVAMPLWVAALCVLGYYDLLP